MATTIKLKRSEVSGSIPTTSDLEIGEISMNIPDGKFFTRTSSNVIKEMGGAGATTLQAVTNQGATTSNSITLNGADIIYEGFLANAFETTLSVHEPTSDNLIRLPDVSGTVITTGNLTKDGTTSGDPLTGEGDAIAFAIALGG